MSLSFMCFNRDGAIYSLNDKPLKLVDQFTYLGSYISSTEIETNIRIGNIKDICLLVNSDKTEFMYFNQDGVIYSLNDKSMKLVSHFTYLSSNILSTEGNISIRIGKVWTTIINHIEI